VLVFGLVKEFIIDIFGKEHDSFMSSLQDFAFYMVGAAVGIIVVAVMRTAMLPTQLIQFICNHGALIVVIVIPSAIMLRLIAERNID